MKYHGKTEFSKFLWHPALKTEVLARGTRIAVTFLTKICRKTRRTGPGTWLRRRPGTWMRRREGNEVALMGEVARGRVEQKEDFWLLVESRNAKLKSNN